MRKRSVLLVVALLLIAGCGSDADETANTTLAPTTTTTVDETTTTTSVSDDEATTTESAPDDGVTVTKDIVYLELNDHEYLLDVYAPDGEGPWPVVIALHGIPATKSHPTNTVVAQAAAEAGMLVFAPNWVAEMPQMSAMDAEWIRAGGSVLPCVLAFAQQEAAGYGGDSDHSVVYGFSGGATTGSRFLFGPTRELSSGCVAQTPPMAPVGAVLGDAEYFNHAVWWDGAFDKDPKEMQTIVAERVDPALWNDDLPTRVRLWAAEDGSFPRSFDDPWDEDGWFAERDPDGSIRDDLDELGALDDGLITYIDSGLLLDARLQRAGIDVTFDILPGGHRVDDKIPELVAYLLDAAGTN